MTAEEIQKGLDKAYKEAGRNAYFGNGFVAGIEFANNHHKEASKELVEALKDKKETLIEYQKFLIKNELIGSNAYYNAELFLKSKIK